MPFDIRSRKPCHWGLSSFRTAMSDLRDAGMIAEAAGPNIDGSQSAGESDGIIAARRRIRWNIFGLPAQYQIAVGSRPRRGPNRTMLLLNPA